MVVVFNNFLLISIILSLYHKKNKNLWDTLLFFLISFTLVWFKQYRKWILFSYEYFYIFSNLCIFFILCIIIKFFGISYCFFLNIFNHINHCLWVYHFFLSNFQNSSSVTKIEKKIYARFTPFYFFLGFWWNVEKYHKGFLSFLFFIFYFLEFLKFMYYITLCIFTKLLILTKFSPKQNYISSFYC